jgi:hypothetical protein
MSHDISDNKSALPTDYSEKPAFAPRADSPENGAILKIDLPEEKSHLTIADVLRGTGVQELTPFDHKAALINV